MTLTDIGEAANGLICLTNNTNCCLRENIHSDWFQPDGTKLQTEGMVYTERGPSVIRLNRRNNASLPTGLFRCSIFDTNNTRQDIYVGVYESEQGAVVVQNLILEKSKQALMCTSAGGPPAIIKWTKDGQTLNTNGPTYKQRQIVIDASSSTYRTTLLIHPMDMDQNKVVGNYTCMVSNSRVTSPSKSHLEIQGK